MNPAILNLVIPSGADFSHTIQLKHGLVLRGDLMPGGGNSIKIDPLPIELPNNFLLSFPSPAGSIDLITTARTPINTPTISIQPYTGTAKLAAGSIAPTLPQNLTGHVWRGALRRKYHDATPLFDFGFVLDPLNGLMTMKATAAQTRASPPNAIYSDFPKKNLHLDTSFTAQVWNSAYFWDVECLQNGLVQRVFNGRAWVTWGATR
jgi:hypothetical protein